MNRYTTLDRIGDGAFGIVYRAQQQSTGEIVAVKKMKQKFQTWEECLALPEILSLRRVQHYNIIKLKEVVRESADLFFIFEFMEGSVFNIQKKRLDAVGHGGAGVFNEREIRSVMAQVLLGLQAVHRGGFMHRDLKPENLLCRGDAVKIGDFGLAKEIRSRPPFTEYVSTRWYRSPEILLRSPHYNSPVDIWAAGIIFAELYLSRAFVPGSSDFDQLFKICSAVGSPAPQDWDEGFQLARRLNVRIPSVTAPDLQSQIPNASPEAINLLQQMLRFNPSDRPTAAQCLQHPFFCQHISHDISAHYQGISSGMNHNPFQQAHNTSQMPGSNTTGNSTPIRSQQQQQLGGGGGGGQMAGGSMPPPPIVGAAAHRQSPLGVAGVGGGVSSYGTGLPQGRVSNSPVGASQQQHTIMTGLGGGGGSSNNHTRSSSVSSNTPQQYGGGGGSLVGLGGGGGRSASTTSQDSQQTVSIKPFGSAIGSTGGGGGGGGLGSLGPSSNPQQPSSFGGGGGNPVGLGGMGGASVGGMGSLGGGNRSTYPPPQFGGGGGGIGGGGSLGSLGSSSSGMPGFPPPPQNTPAMGGGVGGYGRRAPSPLGSTGIVGGGGGSMGSLGGGGMSGLGSSVNSSGPGQYQHQHQQQGSVPRGMGGSMSGSMNSSGGSGGSGGSGAHTYVHSQFS